MIKIGKLFVIIVTFQWTPILALSRLEEKAGLFLKGLSKKKAFSKKE